MKNEKSQIIISDPEKQVFRHSEDYILFGLLVSHGLFHAGDMETLARAQEESDGEPLVELLSRSSELPDKTRSNLKKLLGILQVPELSNFLPSSLPPVETIVETLRQPPVASPVAPTVRIDPAQKDTEIDYPHRGDASTIPARTEFNHTVGSDSPSYTKSLTAEEIKRLEKARVKGDLIGEELAGHVIIDRLGSGGQGDVFLAKQLSLNRYVALKKLAIPPSADRTHFIEAFRAEARTLGKISHSRIVKVYEIFEVNETAFFTMEYVSGNTLKDVVAQAGGAPALDVVANLACQACGAFELTAAEGLVHRDIKPANMLLDTNGDLKIVDFGLAAAAAEMAASETTFFAGTPSFASPEQFELKPLTPMSDLYSLGATLYYTLTGRPPFSHRTLIDLKNAHLTQTPDPPSQINNEIPTEIDRIVLRMMEKDPEKRYASFSDCFSDWEQVLIKSSKGSVSPARQLLADSLLRFGKEEKEGITKTAFGLGAAWILVTGGAMLGEARLRHGGMSWFLDACGLYGTILLAFSLSCIFYVAMARRKWLPVFGSLRTWLYTHIATAIPAVILILIHSGNFLVNVGSGPRMPPPVLTIVISITLLVTAISGTVGLLIFRNLRRKVLLQQLQLRGGEMSEGDQNRLLLGARVLSGWRLIHYPLAIFFILLTILHILQVIRFTV
ncbi:MAG: serine/threonine protein kinase [Candidatus Sumerlaeia bacterium]|nr:serine/threonine protein kinase [Candidatus Sumerlaeia bacterium]